ncbi:MAG: hypothetical protein PHI85_08840 [Victivallaceae bacterium]|nr:hypothetical protein [Victivallaceae bacterium]
MNRSVLIAAVLFSALAGRSVFAAGKLDGGSKASYAGSRALVVRELDDNKLLEFDVASEVATGMLGARSVRQTFDGMSADEVIAWVKASLAPSYNEALKKMSAMTPDELGGYLKVVREAAQTELPAEDRGAADAPDESAAVGDDAPSDGSPQVKIRQSGDAPVLNTESAAKFRISEIKVAGALSDDERIRFVAALATLEEALGTERLLELADGRTGSEIVAMATSGYSQKMKKLDESAAADRGGALQVANTYIKEMTFATSGYYRDADRFLDDLSDADFLAFVAAAGVLNAGNVENAVRLLYGKRLAELIKAAETASGAVYREQLSAYLKLPSSSVRRLRKTFSHELDAAAKKYR